jgi:hypothetical protein
MLSNLGDRRKNVAILIFRHWGLKTGATYGIDTNTLDFNRKIHSKKKKR